MINKRFGIFGILLVFGFFIIGNVSSLSCSLETTCTTPNPGEGVVIALSDITNAHAELRGGENNYPKFVCCDFEGTDVCRNNEVGVSLSDATNAHAELTGTGSYANDVCFGALQCRSGDNLVCLQNEFEMFSLYSDTNAHLGEFDEYDYKVCCSWTANAYWADADDKSVVKSLAAVGDRVSLVLNNSGMDVGENVYNDFLVFEKDGALNPDDEVLPREGGSIISGNAILTGESVSFLSGEWEITLEDYQSGQDFLVESAPDEFYFNANGIESGYLKIVDRDAGTAFCEDFIDQEVCSTCSNHLDCSAAYNSANEVSQESFGVGCGGILPDDENYKTNCFCQWDDSSSKCGAGVSYVSSLDKTVMPHCKDTEINNGETGLNCGDPAQECGPCNPETDSAYEHCLDNLMNEDEVGLDCGGEECGSCSYSISFPKIGSCSYVNTGEDDCADGFLEYNWIGNWEWGVSNGFATTDNVFSSDENDYVQENGLWYYDPLKSSQNCIGGSNVITCPAQVQLPFFGFFGFITSLFLIGGVYMFLIFKRKI